MYFPKPSINENDLAIIERGDTAAHSIEAGQYVSWKGRTGKAKAAILQGASLSEELFDYDEIGLINVMDASKTPMFIDASKSPHIVDNGESLTAPFDGFFIAVGVNSGNIYLNGTRVYAWDNDSGINVKVACGFIKKGQTVSGGGRKMIMRCCF